jgi:hypothetical protein
MCSPRALVQRLKFLHSGRDPFEEPHGETVPALYAMEPSLQVFIVVDTTDAAAGEGNAVPFREAKKGVRGNPDQGLDHGFSVRSGSCGNGTFLDFRDPVDQSLREKETDDQRLDHLGRAHDQDMSLLVDGDLERAFLDQIGFCRKQATLCVRECMKGFENLPRGHRFCSHGLGLTISKRKLTNDFLSLYIQQMEPLVSKKSSAH